jgi:hypothetical protein
MGPADGGKLDEVGSQIFAGGTVRRGGAVQARSWIDFARTSVHQAIARRAITLVQTETNQSCPDVATGRVVRDLKLNRIKTAVNGRK